MPTDDPRTLLRILFPRPGRGGARAGAGRPRKASALSDRTLVAHVTADQKARIEAAAARAGESVSEYLVRSALARHG